MIVTMEPPDIQAVRADEDLIATLGLAKTLGQAVDAERARVLVVWRRELDAEPVGQVVDLETAAVVIAAARRRRERYLTLVAVVTVLVAVLAMVGLLEVLGWWPW